MKRMKKKTAQEVRQELAAASPCPSPGRPSRRAPTWRSPAKRRLRGVAPAGAQVARHAREADDHEQARRRAGRPAGWSRPADRSRWPLESSVKACRKAGSGIPIGPWPNSIGAGTRCMKSAWKTSGFSWCGMCVPTHTAPATTSRASAARIIARPPPAGQRAARRAHAPAEASSTPARNASTKAAGSIPSGSSTRKPTATASKATSLARKPKSRPLKAFLPREEPCARPARRAPRSPAPDRPPASTPVPLGTAEVPGAERRPQERQGERQEVRSQGPHSGSCGLASVAPGSAGAPASRTRRPRRGRCPPARATATCLASRRATSRATRSERNVPANCRPTPA